MTKLIPIFLITLVLAYLSHRYSDYDYLEQDYRRKDRVFFFIMAVAMILFAGLRTAYNDTFTYKQIYNAIPKNVDLFEGLNWLALGDNPGFMFTNRVLVRLGFSTQSYLMFYAIFTMGIYVWFIHKYTSNIWLSFFLMFTMGIFTFPLAAIKQCAAVAFCVLATDKAIQKKYVSCVVLTLIASFYHPYALMYLVVPFLFFRPWSGLTYWMLVLFGLAGIFLESLLGTVLSITDMLGEGYDANSFNGEGINPFRLAVHMVPLLISFMLRPSLRERNDRANNLMTNLSMLNAEIMFVGLFGTANYFGRLANYFQIFQCIALPWLFTHFNAKSKQLIIIVSCICYLMYFVYTYAMGLVPFDTDYRSTSLGDYLMSLLQ